MRILIVTAAYPQNNVPEKAFIIEELRQFAESGASVTLAPIRPVTRVDPGLPSGVVVTEAYAQSFARHRLPLAFLQSLFSRHVWRELVATPRLVLRTRFWKEAIRVTQARAVFSKQTGSYDVFYTFWFTGDTIGLAGAGVGRLVTRAHGYDVYEDVPVNHAHIPFRRHYKADIDQVITLSAQARDYFRRQFGWPEAKVTNIPLGVLAQHKINLGPVEPNKVVFVSCAYPSPNKRLALIGDVMSEFAARHPGLHVTWCHFGAKVSEVMPERLLPPNLVIDARGEQPREHVLDFYAEAGVTAFINLSLSEGQPVSMMEAMSFGIPVVATAVGGMPEMLSEGGGLLVGVQDDAKTIAEHLDGVIEPPARWRLGQQARDTQRRTFDARRNARQVHELFSRLAGQEGERSDSIAP